MRIAVYSFCNFKEILQNIDLCFYIELKNTIFQKWVGIDFKIRIFCNIKLYLIYQIFVSAIFIIAQGILKFMVGHFMILHYQFRHRIVNEKFKKHFFADASFPKNKGKFIDALT